MGAQAYETTDQKANGRVGGSHSTMYVELQTETFTIYDNVRVPLLMIVIPCGCGAWRVAAGRGRSARNSTAATS